ncbi:MAG: YggU family protein [Firmicutes bacterium HGW-Firmicutes-15]|nr:MAG: YggU family protein [Firmicutes bacterium HGW-Firmicutes-15]
MLRVGEVVGGVRLEVRVQPRSSRNQVVGEQSGALKVKLTAPPVDGEANAALVAFLSGYLKIPRKDINLIKGETSRNKIVEIMGISPEELMSKIDI